MKHYIGETPAQVKVLADPLEGIPLWYKRKLQSEAWKEKLFTEDFMEKYNITGDPITDLDYDPYFDEDWSKDERI